MSNRDLSEYQFLKAQANGGVLFVVSLSLAFAILAFDLWVELGVAAGVLYVALVCLSDFGPQPSLDLGCCHNVRRLGGRIELESVKGETVFTVELPQLLDNDPTCKETR